MPTHPELLDHLANNLIADGWSLKQLHRDIVTSATYRQSTGPAGNDPDTRLWGRYPRRRLESEAIRDAILAAAGTYTVEVLQGCGTGQGGRVVEVEVGATKLSLTVIDTGGFQAFKPVTAGTVTIEKPGRHTLTLRPKSKAKAAVMDVRQVTLTPAR